MDRFVLAFGFALLGGVSLHAAGPDPASSHGMLIFGEKATYLSHLPMFHSPHDYQVIFEVKLDPKAAQAFQAARAAAPKEKVWTLVPENFVLPEQVASGKAFRAEIYQGHFERGGTRVVKDIQVSVESVVHYRKFRMGAPADKNSYFTFGKAGDLYAAHTIQRAPDFDRIVAVEIGPDGGLKERKEIYLETGDLE